MFDCVSDERGRQRGERENYGDGGSVLVGEGSWEVESWTGKGQRGKPPPPTA